MIVNTYARVLSLINEIESNDISVYGAHPGQVKTDMDGPEASLSVEEGAVNEVFLLELPDGINNIKENILIIARFPLLKK